MCIIVNGNARNLNKLQWLEGGGGCCASSCTTWWWAKYCLACCYIIGDNMFCCRSSQGQIILPLSSYDSSLDFSEMLPPSHFLPFPTLSKLSAMSSRSSSVPPHAFPHRPPLFLQPLKMWITSWIQFRVFVLTSSLFLLLPHQARMCLQLLMEKNILTDKKKRWNQGEETVKGMTN